MQIRGAAPDVVKKNLAFLNEIMTTIADVESHAINEFRAVSEYWAW